MKKKKIGAFIMATLLSISTLTLNKVNAQTRTKYQRLSGMMHYGQCRDYWCGYAALQTVINNEYYNNSSKVNWYHQHEVADAIWALRDTIGGIKDPYIRGNELGQIYSGSYKGSSDTSAMPAVVFLNNKLKRTVGCTYKSIGANYHTRYQMISAIHGSLDKKHGVMMCGAGNLGTHTYDGHWIAIDGYANYKDPMEQYYYIVDPAIGCPEMNYTGDRYYSVPLDELYEYFKGCHYMYYGE